MILYKYSYKSQFLVTILYIVKEWIKINNQRIKEKIMCLQMHP